MTRIYELGDGTVVQTKESDWKAAKKFEGNEQFVVLLMTMFPPIRKYLLETMYSLIMDSEFSHFVRVVLAVLMVEERFGELPEYGFDDFYAVIGSDVFNVYVYEGKPVNFSEENGVQLKQLKISDQAVDKLISLLYHAKEVDDMTPEPVIAIEDLSPQIYQEEENNQTVILDGEDCDACDLCRYLDHILESRLDYRDFVPEEHTCKRLREDYVPKSPRLFSYLLSDNYNQVLYFSSRTFMKLQDVRLGPRTHIPSNKLWFLFRMPWEYNTP